MKLRMLGLSALIVAGLAACGSSTTTGFTKSQAFSAAASIESQAASANASASSASAAASSSSSSADAPSLTTSQEQAIIAAKAYLKLGSGFSRQGLIDQLSSPVGGGFPLADATFAVDSLNIDYNAQAVLAGKGYLKLGTGFSHAGLVQQLSSPYGGKFTTAQAEYAATQAGL